MMAAADVVQRYLADTQLAFEQSQPGTFVVEVPGERKLKTAVSIVVGDHSLSLNAFVARHPDENHAEVYRWLLQRNARMFGIAYSVDHLGDIYLVGRLPLEQVTADALDRLMGAIAEHADGDFNTILEKGFSTAIQAEWRWRLSRGESTRNLEAFRHLAPQEAQAPDG
jgi:hypothetical protein